jgi:hypothetical protein
MELVNVSETLVVAAVRTSDVEDYKFAAVLYEGDIFPSATDQSVTWTHLQLEVGDIRSHIAVTRETSKIFRVGWSGGRIMDSESLTSHNPIGLYGLLRGSKKQTPWP